MSNQNVTVTPVTVQAPVGTMNQGVEVPTLTQAQQIVTPAAQSIQVVTPAAQTAQVVTPAAQPVQVVTPATQTAQVITPANNATIKPFAPNASSNDFQPTNNGGDSNISGSFANYAYGCIGYITACNNHVKTHEIPSQEASAIYKKFYEAHKDDPTVNRKDALDVNGKVITKTVANVTKTEEVELTKDYSLKRFRSFCYDDFRKIYDKNYKRFVINERKPEYFVLQNITEQGAVNYAKTEEALSEHAKYSDSTKGLHFVNKKNLANVVISTNAEHIPVFLGTNRDPRKPDGSILVNEDTKDQADGTQPTLTSGNETVKYIIYYVKMDNLGVRTLVPSCLHLGLPYAVNRVTTTQKEYKEADIKASKNGKSLFLNVDAVNDVYQHSAVPFDIASVGEKISFSKDKYPIAEEKRAAIEASYTQINSTHYGKLWAGIGVTDPAVLAGIRSRASVSGSRGPSIKDIYANQKNLFLSRQGR